MTKVLTFTTMLLAAVLVSGCDGGGEPESAAESTPTTTTETETKAEDADKPAATE